jgi:membrane protein
MATKQKALRGWSLLKHTFEEFNRDECPRKAAALSYYTIFSLPPLLVIIIIIAGVVLSPEEVEVWIQGEVGEAIGAGAAGQIQTMVERARSSVEGGLSFGLVLGIAGLLFGATGTFAELQGSLNDVWEVKPDPQKNGIKSFLMKRIFSLGMILVIAFLLLVFLVITSMISAVSDHFGSMLPGGVSTILLWVINFSASLLVITFLFAAMFKVLPDARTAWRDLWVGAFATALLFVLGKFLIGLYVGRSNPGEVFGAAAALALILVWVYYSAMILFLGAEFTQAWSQRHGQRVRPESGAMRVVKQEKIIREPAGHPARH